jgi:hypothetical protein
MLITYLQSNERTNGDLFEFTLRRGFLPKHATQILIKLQAYDKLKLKKCDNSKVRKGAFYLNYKDYKDNFDKLIIKIK